MYPNESASTKGSEFAVASVIVAALGLVLPFLPVDMTGLRHYVALPVGVVGLLLAVVSLGSGRRGKPIATAGAVISGLVIVLGLFMTATAVLG